MAAQSCLVTGGSGFLGRHVVETLRQAGHPVTVLSRRPLGQVETVLADLSADAPFELQGAFHSVFHLAGAAHSVPKTAAEGERFFQVNREGTRRLLAALERLSRLPEALVFAGTVAVYGKEEGTLLDEQTPRSAADPYGASKREAEDLLLEWGDRRGVRVSVLRLPLVVGAGASGNLQAMVEAMRRGRYMGIGRGEARRSMVAAEDVARILPAAAQTSGVFHLTDGHHPSFAELEAALAAALGVRQPRRLPLWIARTAALAGDIAGALGISAPINSRVLNRMTQTLTFSDQRARTWLGWNPSRVLDEVFTLSGRFTGVL